MKISNLVVVHIDRIYNVIEKNNYTSQVENCYCFDLKTGAVRGVLYTFEMILTILNDF